MRKFEILDVFAQRAYEGNQLAVFTDSRGLTADEMQHMAAEMHYSETSFIDPDKTNGAYRVRIFTPAHEVPFAGHPTLGTADVIRRLFEGGKADEILLDMQVGRIPVTVRREGERDVYRMRQVEPEFRSQLPASRLAPVIGLDEADFDAAFPIEEVSTGLAHIIVPLRSLDALKRARTNRDAYFALIATTWAKNVLIFCPEPHEPGNHISVRMFADYLGIPEDPATGSGCGCLAGYMVRHRCFGKPEVDIRAEQGYEIDRPSLLFLRANERDGRIDISVGGSVVRVARGEFGA